MVAMYGLFDCIDIGRDSENCTTKVAAFAEYLPSSPVVIGSSQIYFEERTMYIPRANQEDRIPVIHKLMEEQPFASLITMGTSGLFASHIPMVLERDGTPFGRLKCHLSRANQQWRDSHPPSRRLRSSPAHSTTSRLHGIRKNTRAAKVVPTWNYVVVHAYGHLR